MAQPNVVSAHEHLLDTIAKTLGCPALSSMKTPCWQAFVRLALPPVEQINLYGLKEWNDTAQYIFSVSGFDTKSDARAAMVSLSQNKCEEIQDCLLAVK